MRNFVAVDIANGLYGEYVRLIDADGVEQYISLKGTTFDQNGRLVGKVVGFDRRRRYWVNFNGGFDYQVKLKNCYEPKTLSFPANTKKTRVKIVAERVKAKVWHRGQLREVYLRGKEIHGANAKAFRELPGNKLEVIEGKTFLDDKNILYFLEHQ